MRSALILCLAALAAHPLTTAFSAPEAEAKPRGKAKHVVLIVWDGMRADFATAAHAPTLAKLATTGVNFRRHHSVYPTLTSVNATVLATGVHPARSGVLGNYEYRPEVEPSKSLGMNDPASVRLLDQASGGRYLLVPTVAELVQARGGRTAIAGTKSAPIAFDRQVNGPAPRDSVTLVEGTTLPASAFARFRKVLGPYPNSVKVPSSAQDRWTTRALTEVLWKDGLPELSVLWLGDPDRTEHATAPGSALSLAAIKSSDACLATVLAALEKKGVRAQTDVLVVSDHGFSTIARPLNIAALLEQDGFPILRGEKPAGPDPAIRVIGNGGTIFFYVTDHDAPLTRRLAEWLQQQDFSGVIFSRAKTEGTFPLAQVHLETAAGPDVVLSGRWSERPNEFDAAGTIEANGKGDAKGTHGTLSPFDVHNLFVAAGPDFRKGLNSAIPTSNLDLAPLIMQLLGLPARELDGRVPIEALAGDTDFAPAVQSEIVEASRPLSHGIWRQKLHLSRVGETIYLDEGNGGLTPAQP